MPKPIASAYRSTLMAAKSLLTAVPAPATPRPHTGARWFSFLVAGVGALLLLLSVFFVPASWPAEHIPWWYLIALYGIYHFSYNAHRLHKSASIASNYANNITLVGICVFGVSWQIIFVYTAARFVLLRVIRREYFELTLAWFFIGTGVLETAIPGAAWALTRLHHPQWMAIMVMLVATYAVTLTLSWVYGALADMPLFSWKEEILFLLFTVPFVLSVGEAIPITHWALLTIAVPLVLVWLSATQEGDLDVAQRQLTLDFMTGLSTKAVFLSSVAERAAAPETPAAVVMLDIDNFKKLNDTHGHLEGDRALIAVATVLGTAVRVGDVAARYGGEEFGSVLLNVDEAQALDVAQRICDRCRDALQEWGTSVSIGVKMLEAGFASEQLVDLADQALYQAKKSGKDRVVMFSEVTIDG